MSRQNVLIYRVGQLGDTLVALPSVEAVARKHPGCRLVLLTDRHASHHGYVSSWDILGPTGLLDEVIFYEPREQTPLMRLRQMMSLLARLRGYHFVYGYNLVMRTSKLAVWRDKFFFYRLAGLRHYIGMRSICYPPPTGLRGQLPVLEPEWRRLLQQVDPAAQRVFHLPVAPASRAEALSAWPGYALASSVCTIAFAPGSKMGAKIWPEKRFTELGLRLLSRWTSLRIIVVGGLEDTALGDRLCDAWGAKGINLAGKLSIYASAAALSQCKLYIGNDTGTMHLAAMVGVPCVAIFSSRDYPGLWEPYGTGHTVLRKEMDCSGCMLETCVDQEMACLMAISVDEVFDAAMMSLCDAP